jgi:hypothetical protein
VVELRRPTNKLHGAHTVREWPHPTCNVAMFLLPDNCCAALHSFFCWLHRHRTYGDSEVSVRRRRARSSRSCGFLSLESNRSDGVMGNNIPVSPHIAIRRTATSGRAERGTPSAVSGGLIAVRHSYSTVCLVQDSQVSRERSAHLPTRGAYLLIAFEVAAHTEASILPSLRRWLREQLRWMTLWCSAGNCLQILLDHGVGSMIDLVLCGNE